MRSFELNDQVNSLMGYTSLFVYWQGSFRMIERKLKMNIYTLTVRDQLITTYIVDNNHYHWHEQLLSIA